MAIEASDALDGFLWFLSGEHFPRANEDDLYARAAAYERFASDIDASAPLLVAAIESIRDGIKGQTERAFVESMQQYVNDPGYLFIAGRHVHRMGYAHHDLAAKVEYTKLMIIAAVVELLLELMVAAALSFFDPWAVPKSIGPARVFMERFLGQLLTRVITAAAVSVAIQEAMQVGMDFFVQLHLHVRRDVPFDLHQLRTSRPRSGRWPLGLGLGWARWAVVWSVPRAGTWQMWAPVRR